jgi:hypothetical protein
MAAELVVELIAAAGEIALRALLAKPIREWRLNSFYEGLDAEKKTAMLEVVAGAIVHDGHVSDFEKEWLEKRRASNRDDAARVDAALEVAGGTMKGADDAACRSFVAERAKAFADEGDRERVVKVTFVVLRANHASASTFAAFGDGMGVPQTKQGVILARIDQLLS